MRAAHRIGRAGVTRGSGASVRHGRRGGARAVGRSGGSIGGAGLEVLAQSVQVGGAFEVHAVEHLVGRVLRASDAHEHDHSRLAQRDHLPGPASAATHYNVTYLFITFSSRIYGITDIFAAEQSSKANMRAPRMSANAPMRSRTILLIA